MRSMVGFRNAVWAVLACTLVAGAVQAQQRGSAPPAEFGERFPAGVYDNLNAQAGGPAKVDLATVIGRKPVLLYYWIAGHPRADEMFVELQGMVGELGADRLALIGMAMPQPGRDAKEIAKRLAELKITVPVLGDDEFALGARLRVQSVPNITLLDAEGYLRLTNGASLTQVIGYDQTVESAIRHVAEKGRLSTYGYLDRYYPVTELVGKKCPDFEAPLLGKSSVQKWSTMLSPDKLNVLIFWSVNCPHCRKSLPEINAWIKANPEGLNVVSAAAVTSEAVKVKTKEYCELEGFVFPTLVDDQAIAQLYQVTSTPTILLIRPDGVIDSVMLSSTQDFGRKVEELKRKFL